MGFLRILPKELDQLSQQPEADWQATCDWLSKLTFEQFNTGQGVGAPLHPQTRQPSPMAPWQLAFFQSISNTRYHRFHINKARQMGFSELILRIIAYRAFREYAGWEIRIIVGTRSDLTKEMMERLKRLFAKYPEVIDSTNTNALTLRLMNGTRFKGLPASEEAMTGSTQIKCIVMDEAAKWDLVDDSPVVNSILPIVSTNKSDLFMFSTPKGPRGFFYDIERGENEFMKFKYDIWRTQGYPYSKEEIESMLNDNTIDTAQEYLNQYTAGKSSIFGNKFASGGHEAEEF